MRRLPIAPPSPAAVLALLGGVGELVALQRLRLRAVIEPSSRSKRKAKN